MSRRVAVLVLSSFASACGGGDARAPTNSRAAPVVETCRVQLAARQTALDPATPGLPGPPPTRSSRLVAHLELRLASLSKELETKVAPRLADEHGRGIGIAGHLDYTVDRGPFTVAVEGDSLVIRTEVRARAEACRGSRCYASCEPSGRATATVPLRLTSDYRFQPSRVAFAFARGCEVRALGGMVKIDVTPTIQAELAPSLRRVEQEIDGKLPSFRAQAERMWAEIGKPKDLPLGGCVVTNPRGIVEGPVLGTPEALRVRFALVAHPEIRSRCGQPSANRPLPPLTQDPGLPPEDDLVLALVSPLMTTASALEGSEGLDAGGVRARIDRASAVPAGAVAQIDLGLRGEACGDVAVRTPLAWTEDGRFLKLASPVLANGERERTAPLAPNVLVRSLTGIKLRPPFSPEALRDLIPTLAASMSDPGVEVSAKITDVKPLDVMLRADDVAASVLVRGRVDLRQR